MMDTTYVQGFSTSLPRDIQEKMVHSLPGFENSIIKKYAYAIEYDAVDPIQMQASLESKIIENLFTAGQVNGTSGYEEAAGQGIMAGINASMKLEGREPLILQRDEAYIGVLIDDLTTKGTQEPYRLLTSRAEFRLLLRHDNAEERLLEKGYKVGLISQERMDAYLKKQELQKQLEEQLSVTSYNHEDTDVSEYLQSLGYDALTHRVNALELIKRPKVDVYTLLTKAQEEADKKICDEVSIQIKYAGYIEKAKREAKKLSSMDKVKIPSDLNYDQVDNLSIEGRQKLMKFRPQTVGQASRISGVDPSDIAVLVMHLRNK